LRDKNSKKNHTRRHTRRRAFRLNVARVVGCITGQRRPCNGGGMGRDAGANCAETLCTYGVCVFECALSFSLSLSLSHFLSPSPSLSLSLSLSAPLSFPLSLPLPFSLACLGFSYLHPCRVSVYITTANIHMIHTHTHTHTRATTTQMHLYACTRGRVCKCVHACAHLRRVCI